jgi:hypothetical protein
MSGEEIELLKQGVGKDVELVCTDGEVVQAHVISVSEEEREVIYDLISSSLTERYNGRPANTAYLTPFDEINSVRLL